MLRAFILAACVVAGGQSALASDYAVPRAVAPSYQRQALDVCHVRRCGPRGCRIVNVCGCPDRYSCRGLYDAYGPYGGRALLHGYTRFY